MKLQWLKDNAAGLGLVATGAALLALGAACNARLSDYVTISVPREVQSALSVPPRMSLTAAEQAWQDWEAHVKAGTERFSESMANGYEVLGFLSAVTNVGIQTLQATPAIAGLPLGGAGVGLLTFAGGLLLRRPGDAGRERKEKEASYNEGLKRGKALAEELLRAAQPTGAP